MASSNDESIPKKPSRDPVQEWNVVRRTLEHFDNKITNLHTIGLTATFVLFGLFIQTKIYYLGGVIALFNIVLVLEERFTLAYLNVASKVARNIEQKYAFDYPALTTALHKQSTKVGWGSRNAFLILNIIIIVAGFGIIFAEMGLPYLKEFLGI